jgi:cytochrome c biogenesis protein CcmG, thiol:disulfide interchange protein DsbE
MRRLIFILPLLLFAVVAGYFALGLTRDPSVVPSALIDKPVPEFTLPPLLKDGQGLASADLKGKVQLVNVFASWCVPCRIEHPVLMRLAKEQGVTVKAINYKDKPEDAIRWLNQGGNPYSAIGADQDGRVSIDWGVYGVPETFVVDRDGRIAFKLVGPITPENWESTLKPAIEKALAK